MKNYKPSMSDIYNYVTRNISGHLTYEIERHAAHDWFTFYCFNKTQAPVHIHFTYHDTLDADEFIKKMELFVDDNEAIYNSPLMQALR